MGCEGSGCCDGVGAARYSAASLGRELWRHVATEEALVGLVGALAVDQDLDAAATGADDADPRVLRLVSRRPKHARNKLRALHEGDKLRLRQG